MALFTPTSNGLLLSLAQWGRENLGATESIITCPSVMTHANMLKEDREKVGITDGFVRVSCGLEDTDDLIKSLKIAFDAL